MDYGKISTTGEGEVTFKLNYPIVFNKSISHNFADNRMYYCWDEEIAKHLIKKLDLSKLINEFGLVGDLNQKTDLVIFFNETDKEEAPTYDMDGGYQEREFEAMIEGSNNAILVKVAQKIKVDITPSTNIDPEYWDFRDAETEIEVLQAWHKGSPAEIEISGEDIEEKIAEYYND